MVQTEVNGLIAESEYFLCTTQEQGAAEPNCDGGVNVLTEPCTVVGPSATPGSSLLRCQASLADGAHDLTFIGVYGARAVSQTVSINSDCSPPQITDVQIPEDVMAIIA